MTRLARTRASRAIVTVVVLGIVTGAVVEYRRRPGKAAVAAGHPAPAARPSVASATPAAPAFTPMVTRTKPDGVPPMMTAAQPAPTPLAASPLAPAGPVEPAPPAVAAAGLIADAKLKANTDLLAARKMLNDALLAGGLSDADATAVKREMADLNTVIVFSSRIFPADPLGGSYKVEPGDRLVTIANKHAVPFQLLLQLNHLADARKLRSGQTIKTVNGPFYAVVSKSRFTIDLYLGGPGGSPTSMYVTSFPVGLGTDDSTPTGTWVIKNKAASPAYDSPRGEGHIAAGDPKNPLGPYWLGLEGTDGKAVGAQSYGIHGTIDPDSIGKMASLGCIRLRNDDITTVYKLLVEQKSTVLVKD